MNSFASDLRFGWRVLVRAPAVTAAAVAALALGIGANTAVFSLVSAVLLRPLPYREPDRLVWLWQRNTAHNLPVVPVSPADFMDWGEHSRAFAALAAWRDQNFTVTGLDLPERMAGARVLPALLDVLGVEPALGRKFAAGEGRAGGERVAILTHGLWQRRFGGDRAVLGRTIVLDGAPHAIVGVMPRQFQFPFGQIELLAPWTPDAGELAQRGAKSRFLRVIARLKGGLRLEEARAEMAAISRRQAQDFPASNKGWDVNVLPLRDFFVEDFRPALWVLAGAVGLVLLIACGNVANLLLARATARRREMALRAALGAAGGRILRQLLTESALLGLAGGAAGMLLAWAGLRPLTAAIPQALPVPVPGLDSVGLDWRVLAFTLALSLAASVIFGLAPGWQTRQPDLQLALREGGRGSTSDPRTGRLRALLVITQVALAVALSITAALALTTFAGLRRTDPGFRTANVLTMRISLPSATYTRPRQRAFYDRLVTRVKTLPGVKDAAVVSYLPLSGTWGVVRFLVEGRATAPEEIPTVNNQVISHEYFRALGMALAAGRFFSERDTEDAPRAAIVNESLARRYWGPEAAAAIGQRLKLEGEGPEAAPLTVVGVVKDIRNSELYETPRPELYRCYPQAPTATMSLVAHTASDPLGLAAALRSEVHALDPALPVYQVRTLERVTAESLWRVRLYTLLAALFAGLALGLASLGIYGVTSYLVNQRRGEIGVRMALGARPAEVLRLVLGQGLTLAAFGAAAGLAMALIGARVMSGVLYWTTSLEPLILIGVPVAVLALAAAANALPAWRASRIAPSVALRHE